MTNKEVDFSKEMANFLFKSKYSRYDDELKRRENWSESVKRDMNMHLKKYNFLSKEDKDEIRYAFKLVTEKKIMASMRSIQYGGKAIEQSNGRIYNCNSRFIDSLRAVAEIFLTLLWGNGSGLGLIEKYLSRLPDLVTAEDKNGIVVTYVVEDTIEGWANSCEALLQCYFRNTPYTGRKIVFDYSKIRKKGEKLKIGGGKAPGYKGLKNSHIKIKNLLDSIIEDLNQIRMNTVNMYDINMHNANAVLSGGSRRSATSVMFLKDDIGMMNAKIDFDVIKKGRFELNEKTNKYEGYVIVNDPIYPSKNKIEVSLSEYDYNKVKEQNKISWIHIHPQRARSNNSVLLLRDELTLEEFTDIVERTKQYGEPGFVFADSEDTLFNPCFEISFIPVTEDGQCGVQFCVSGDTKLLTRDGIEIIKECDGTKIEIWNGKSWSKSLVFKTQENVKLYRVYFSDGSYLDVTENHRFIVKKSGTKKFRENTTKELMTIYNKTDFSRRSEFKSIKYNIDYNDGINEEFAYEYGFFKGDGNMSSNKKYMSANLYRKDKDLNLRGSKKNDKIYYNYNGTEFKTISLNNLNVDICRELKVQTIPKIIFSWNKQSILNFIAGWIDADGSKASNGVRIYGDENSIRLGQLLLTKIGISSSVNLMSKKGEFTNLCERKNDVWYLQITKTNEIPSRRIECNNKIDCKFKGRFQYIKEIKELDGLHDSYCLYEQELNQCVFNNVLTKQCNLTSINGSKVNTEEEFYEYCKYETIIGTLQAGYTDFPFLNNASKKLTEDEALLGCSITGFMNNPDLLFNPEVLEKGAKICVDVNKIWAEKIGINQASRITCVKPEGTGSLTLADGEHVPASGIHPHHAKRYFRRVQCNKIDPVYKFFKKHNPHMCEESVWSENKTDDVITFPIELKDEHVIVKDDLTAIQHLKYAKLVQKHWVINGTTEKNKKPIHHNVSLTVEVADNEWEEVIKYIYDNRKYFSAISLLPKSGDKIYQQAPLERIITEEDEEKLKMYKEKYKVIDWNELVEEEDNTSLQSEMSCAGGQCDIL